MALDKKYMLMITGVGKDKIGNLRLASSKLSICPPSAVIAFNTKLAAKPVDKIHGELAFRMFPYLKDAYSKTVNLLAVARSYVRENGDGSDLGSSLPAPDNLSGLTDLSLAAIDVADVVDKVKRRDRSSEEHTAMKNAIDAVVPTYFALAIVCEQALRD